MFAFFEFFLVDSSEFEYFLPKKKLKDACVNLYKGLIGENKNKK